MTEYSSSPQPFSSSSPSQLPKEASGVVNFMASKDRPSFDAYFQKIAGFVQDYVMHMTAMIQIPQDKFQEAVSRSYLAAKKVVDEDDLLATVFREFRVFFKSEWDAAIHPSMITPSVSRHDVDADDESVLPDNDRLSALALCVSMLPGSQREIFLLLYKYRFSEGEVSIITTLSAKKVNTDQKNLLKILAKAGFENVDELFNLMGIAGVRDFSDEGVQSTMALSALISQMKRTRKGSGNLFSRVVVALVLVGVGVGIAYALGYFQIKSSRDCFSLVLQGEALWEYCWR